MITPQKVRAVLRKAGCSASKRHRSKMIRGWSDWSPGYRVTEVPGTIVVHSNHLSRETRESQLARYFGILTIAGICAVMGADRDCILISK